MSAARCAIREYFNNTVFSNRHCDESVGVEFEFPIVSEDGTVIEPCNLHWLFHELNRSAGFQTVACDDQGGVIHVRHIDTNISISLEYSYANLEFSIGPCLSLCELNSIFITYYDIVVSLLRIKKYKLVDQGINPVRSSLAVPRLRTGFHHAVNNTIEQLAVTSEVQSIISPGQIASAQTHLNVDKNQMIQCLSFHARLNWIRAFLFSNSPLHEDNGTIRTLCARDEVWRTNGLTTGDLTVFNTFNHTECYYEHLERALLFGVMRDNEYYYFPGMTLKNFFSLEKVLATKYTDGVNDICGAVTPQKSDVQFLKILDYVRLSRFGTVEIRSDCMQPIADVFAPAAFNVGVHYARDEVIQLLDSFDIPDTNIRDFAARNGLRIMKEKYPLKVLITSICDCALEGLRRRGLNEERHLQCVFERLKHNKNPAERLIEMQLIASANV